ncbi:MAG: hypothetical protein Q8P80_01545, partial [Candidatus Levybacteria bacterium]|nr:hypothetical protein [Candidatus Levybacteria bacterium]
MYLLLAILVVLISGATAVYFSIKEEKTKKELIERERNQKHRLLEISILKEIQERIGYELNLEKIIDVIIGSLKNLFPYSSASALFLEDG